MPQLLQRIFLISGVVMLIDLAYFGPGLVIPGLGLSLRRVLFVVMLVVLIFRRLLRVRPFSKDELAFIAALLGFGLFWGGVIPANYGFPLAFSIADISPWLGLLILAIWPWDAWPAESQWNRFCNFIITTAILLALLHILIWLLLLTKVVTPAAFAFTASLVSSQSDADSFLILVPLDNGQYRVFWSSSLFLLSGIYFLFMARRASRKFAWYLGLALAAFALFTTYIRAFLGAMFIMALLSVYLRAHTRRRPLRRPVATILAFWIFSVTSVSIAINPSFLDTLGLSRSESDIDRVDQASALLEQFASHPLLGTGYGSYVAHLIRGTEAPFSYELVFYALLMKLGVVGICMLVLILGLALRVALADKLAYGKAPLFAVWLAFTTGLWFAGATNPMVTNFVGMTLVVLVLVDMRIRAGQPA